MADSVVLNKANPLSAAEDYDFLRREGIKHIEKLSGNIWTDYNTHDPGITLLEALCYAITDLTYRTKFDMKDLLAPLTRNSDSWKNIFYTAREILPCNPVTLNDYRKLLIDIVGIRNAWITISKDCEVPMYITYPSSKDFDVIKKEQSSLNPCNDENKIQLNLVFEPDKDELTTDKIIELNGLYKIIIEFEEDVIEKHHKDEVRQKALHKLHSHRSICEDYVSVTAAEYKDFNLQTEVVLKEDADAEMVLAQICFCIQKYFTPNNRFYSLEELLEKGIYAEDIFEGPFLKHGFILDEELEKTDFFRDMRLSDIINDVSDVDGIIALNIFKILDNNEDINDTNDQCSNEKYFDEWIDGMKKDKLIGKLNVDDLAAQLNLEDVKASGNIVSYIAPVKLFKSGERVTINVDRFIKLLKDLQTFDRNKKLQGHSTDFQVPIGENMNLEDFYPVQYMLPQTYKVGEQGLPMSEGNTRLVQALQLKGYLAIFEQLFLNFLSQLNNINNIFSFNESNVSDFSAKIIDHDNTDPTKLKEKISGYLHLYVDSELYIKKIQNITEPHPLFEKRRNKILDHLLARFSEQFQQYDSLMKYLYPKDYLSRVIKNKTDLLADYIAISKNRGTAYNYKLEEECWDLPGKDDEEKISCNVSGLERRISRLIGFKDFKRKIIAPENFMFEYTDTLKTKGRIILYDDYENKIILIRSDEIKTKCEDEVMHCFIENGCCSKNFLKLPAPKDHSRRKSHQRGQFSFILRDNDRKTLGRSIDYETEEERDKALEKAEKALYAICHEEGMHMIEHILLRPRADNEEEDSSGEITGTIKYELLNICLDKCDLNVGKNSTTQVSFKFDITILATEDCIDNKRWKVELKRIPDNVVIFEATFKEYGLASAFISTIREYGSEFENFSVFKNEDDPTKYFLRVYDENQNILFESKTCYTSISTNPYFKKKNIKEDQKTVNQCITYSVTDIWTEIINLKEFLAFELDLYCCEDPCDNDEDPYSFRVSFVLPCWSKRLRDKSFRNFVEKTIQSETPAHIHAKIYWLGVEQMRQFEDTYTEWVIEIACNDVPEISIANDFIKIVKQLKNCDQLCEEETTNVG